MAEVNNNNTDSLSIKLPGGSSIGARGSLVILVLLILAGGWLTWTQHRELIQELRTAGCLVRLSVYIHRFPAGTDLDLRNMPPEVWSCSGFIAQNKSKGGIE